MKIKDLIEKLKKLDPELEAVIQDDEMLHYSTLKNIVVEEKHFLTDKKVKWYYDTRNDASRNNYDKHEMGKEKVLVMEAF